MSINEKNGLYLIYNVDGYLRATHSKDYVKHILWFYNIH